MGAPRPPLISAFEAWLKYERRLAHKSGLTYTRPAQLLYEWGDVATMTTSDLQRFLNEEVRSESSRRNALFAFKQFFPFLMKQGVRASDPAAPLAAPAELRRKRKAEPDPALAETLREMEIADRHAFLIALLVIETGLRTGQLTQFPDVGDRVPATVSVRGRGPKPEVFPLSRRARAILRQMDRPISSASRTLQRMFEPFGLNIESLRLVRPDEEILAFSAHWLVPALGRGEYDASVALEYRDEAWVCWASSNHRAAMVLARAALQAMCRRYLPVPTGGWKQSNFFAEAKALTDRTGDAVGIPTRLVREFGNEWAHPDPTSLKTPTHEETREALETVDDVLRTAMRLERSGHLEPLNLRRGTSGI